MKALSLRQAARCEMAKTPHCKCRCGGALHGKFRNSEPDLSESQKRVAKALGLTPEQFAAPGADFFEQLPESDPHHIDDQETKKRKRRAKRKEQPPWKAAASAALALYEKGREVAERWGMPPEKEEP